MRLLCAIVIACLAAGSQAAKKILLVPLDSRPAAGQFAQMIAAIAGVQVEMPPSETLGRFTSPGDPEAVLAWLDTQDYQDVCAVVVSTDMIAYGGLIASRLNDVSASKALERLNRLEAIRKQSPKVPFYCFTSVMRLAPTATRATSPWRMQMAKFVGLWDAAEQSGNKKIMGRLSKLRRYIPKGEISRYYAARKRNHEVQKALVRIAARSFDYLVVGQDDAQPTGPHVRETKELKAIADRLGVGGKIYFCEGVDQNSNTLVSRALLKAGKWTPRVRVVYSDELGKKKIGAYESKSIQETVMDQILASGARPVFENGPHDYTLYVNTPDRRAEPFRNFVNSMRSDLDRGAHVALADINLGSEGTCDRELFEALRDSHLVKLEAFAGWNTPGNTLGTTVPAANLAMLAQRLGFDPVRREIAQKSFLLHRVVHDVIYNRSTRPRAYDMLEYFPGANRDETYGTSFTQMDAFVQQDVRRQLDQIFRDTLYGLQFKTPSGPYEIANIENVKVFLPWPRAYEVHVEFALRARPLESFKLQG